MNELSPEQLERASAEELRVCYRGLLEHHIAETRSLRDRRRHLLARMAGNIAGGLASNSFYVDGVNARLDHEAIEAEAVAMAERILKRIGL